ncbi:MAG: GTP 3',8-cyclase MoaA [Desulfatirhabdiaceae bacterium]
MKLIDPHQRKLSYLRISITDRCNLRCMYCQPGKLSPKLNHEDILSYEELLHIVKIGVDLGIDKVRVTGGEPLVRKGVYGFLEKLVRFPGIRDVSLTTNGVLLKHHAKEIRDAGIRRINISLDTLKPERFKTITGLDVFQKVWDGIQAVAELGFSPIKINTVAMRGVNDDELVDIARLSLTLPFHFRFIEYMPIGSDAENAATPLLTPEIQACLTQAIGPLEPIQNGCLDGPARRFRFADAIGEIGFISAMSHHFCGTCNRLRLTASGQLRSCLLSDHQDDIKTPLRNGATDQEIADIFRESVRHKAMAHTLSSSPTSRVDSRMAAIGG